MARRHLRQFGAGASLIGIGLLTLVMLKVVGHIDNQLIGFVAVWIVIGLVLILRWG